jgi:putative transposase
MWRGPKVGSKVEVWFSMLSAQSLRGASFTAVKELITHIEAFIAAYNQACVPFDWRKINPEVRSFSSKYANLCR